MTMHIEFNEAGCSVAVEGEMTVVSAAGLRDEMLAALKDESETQRLIEMDLSAVGEIDTAGLQILLQLKRCYGTRLRLVNHSPAVLQILELCHLGSHFGDPLVIPSGQRAGEPA